MELDPHLQRIVDTIVRLYAPRRILLFGSHAKGRSKPGSDIDLLVIKESALPRSARGKSVRQALQGDPVAVDLVFQTPEEVEVALSRPHTFLASVLRNGISLYPK